LPPRRRQEEEGRSKESSGPATDGREESGRKERHIIKLSNIKTPQLLAKLERRGEERGSLKNTQNLRDPLIGENRSKITVI